jgi:hypothetical protein
MVNSDFNTGIIFGGILNRVWTGHLVQEHFSIKHQIKMLWGNVVFHEIQKVFLGFNLVNVFQITSH